MSANNLISMMSFKNNTKGVSLPLIIGLVTLLMLGSVAANQLVIRQLRSIQRIESSNRSYLAAEAGLEDALYELSAHAPGYQTPALGAIGARKNQFDNEANWTGEWSISSRTDKNKWAGRFLKNDKLTIFLFNDSHTPAVQPLVNGINSTAIAVSDIKALNVASDFSVTFSLPSGLITSGDLKIDNDNDFGVSSFNNGLNEDAPNSANLGACAKDPEDNDCDGQIDEDSEEDAVILWKLSDGFSKTLSPLRGCLIDSVGGDEKSEICEKDFNAPSYSAEINQNTMGKNELGQNETVASFINRATTGAGGNPNAKMSMDFIITAPLEHVDLPKQKKITIPHINYEVNTSGVEGAKIPYPYFTIQSDGYYRTFKQSITSLVRPRLGTSLLDFTIIQN